ncbi:site-specific integrase [Aeromicrobium sp.]|uniref:tyrosine-type recombinase/integrase n=1 Tax=Aeromicrobium sp. TaxID=1871063 RepID=UPI0030BA77D1
MTSPSNASRARSPRRMFGGIRKLPSGRYQARYVDHAGNRHSAPQTFASKRDADAWIAASQADLTRGTWRDPDLGSQTLTDYLHDYLDTRTDLSPRTVETYGDVSRRWICATLTTPPRGNRKGKSIDLGAMQLRAITVADVREWYAAAVHSQQLYTATRLAAGATSRARRRPTNDAREWGKSRGLTVKPTGRLSQALMTAWTAAGSPAAPAVAPVIDSHPSASPQVAQAYRTLRAVLNAAVRDGLIVANPCQIPRAAEVKAAERVPATASQIVTIAAAMPDHLAAAVHLAAYTGLRAGELFALSREHVDLDAGTVRVERAVRELRGHPPTFGPSKTDSSRRMVHVPPHVVQILRDHLNAHTPAGPSALVFANHDDSIVQTNQRTQIFARARRAAGRSDLRWHDLRHTGATLAAQAGASIREIQSRLGHSTIVAAMRYQHATVERDREIAQRLSDLAVPPANVISIHKSA